MRIIGGIARGTKLYTLEGTTTRPTLDRVKESLFNIIQENVRDCLFLDLFSGSGAIALEALSRGAKKAILCEKDKQAIDIIRKNIEKTHMNGKAELHPISYEKFILNGLKEKPDIIFIDPPYKTDFAQNSIKILIEKNKIDKDTLLIVETDEEERIVKEIEKMDVEIIDHRKYGRAHLIFIKYKMNGKG